MRKRLSLARVLLQDKPRRPARRAVRRAGPARVRAARRGARRAAGARRDGADGHAPRSSAAARLCDRALLLEEGQLVWAGLPPSCRTTRCGQAPPRERLPRGPAQGPAAAVADARAAASPCSCSAPSALLLFSFAVGPNAAVLRQHAAGFLWLGLLLVLDARRSRRASRPRWSSARSRGCCCCPPTRGALYYGKAARQLAAAHAARRGSRAGDGRAVRCGDGHGSRRSSGSSRSERPASRRPARCTRR